jgi:hypothetical protein
MKESLRVKEISIKVSCGLWSVFEKYTYIICKHCWRGRIVINLPTFLTMSVEKMDASNSMKQIVAPSIPIPENTFQTHDHRQKLKKIKCCDGVGIRAPAIFERW